MLFDNKKLVRSVGEATIFIGFLILCGFFSFGVAAFWMWAIKASGGAILMTIITLISIITTVLYQTEEKDNVKH